MDAPVGHPTLLRQLVETVRAFEQQLHAGLLDAADDLRPAHYAVFRHLEPDGSRIRDLASAAGMTPQAMGELVAHLAACDYVEMRRHPTDGRARLVVPTARGHAALSRAAARLGDLEGALAARLGTERVHGLGHLLAEMLPLLSDPELAPVAGSCGAAADRPARSDSRSAAGPPREP
ncbi:MULTISPECIES: MarR family winged helix-turn-helix transcriptional regulator [Actinoalloteichus]|uniref:Transcriptional regulator, MarR family n=1 Tax=Actinoalloteichus fjordicus TaxID=1612552 RepID=A0AAC9LHL4_9PSEU|nr:MULTISPECIES: MarR family winged helix-turn-helix transcriptional regulator [Actinoalloteichus]APU16469.1 transcriptional regulator, MarR family [Actinoalloteichus fjordicus]APU22528.1 transcriptional regulator, MarR family [Actinoalloteichus sp. GBA129-24]